LSLPILYYAHDTMPKFLYSILESGENDNLIIQNLKKDPHAFGIFGFVSLNIFVNL
jgi:hypothetical protein